MRACSFICQAAVAIKFGAGPRHQDFWPQHRVGIGERESLPQLRLRACCAGHPWRSTYNSAWLAVQRAVGGRPRQPIDRILQHPGHAVVVLGRGNQDRIGLHHSNAKLVNGGRSGRRFHISVVKRDSRKVVRDDRERHRREFDRSVKQRAIERTCSQAPHYPNDAKSLHDVNRLTNSSAVSATSRQPASIVSECPRPGILTISVTPLLRFCFL